MTLLETADALKEMMLFAKMFPNFSYLLLCFKISKLAQKLYLRGELGRLQKVQQTEQLLYCVLKWSAC